jgi:hypothetical protein
MIPVMGITKLASSALFACCACLACGGNARRDDGFNSDATSGTAGAADVTGNTNGGRGGNSDGSARSGGAANHGGSASAGQGNASNGSGGGNPIEEYTGPGTITAPWSGFCVATFTADYAVTDAFKKPLFTARAGEQYLIMSFFAEFSASLAYLTPHGPIEFDVGVDVDETLPFTSSCSPQLSTYYAVFADVSVFAELGLENKLCDLTSGTAAAREPQIAGYSLEANSGTGAIYEIHLNAFSARCGGVDKGYIRVPAITALGSVRMIVPFQLILGQP